MHIITSLNHELNRIDRRKSILREVYTVCKIRGYSIRGVGGDIKDDECTIYMFSKSIRIPGRRGKRVTLRVYIPASNAKHNIRWYIDCFYMRNGHLVTKDSAMQYCTFFNDYQFNQIEREITSI